MSSQLFGGGLAALYIYKCLNIPYIITEHSTIYARGLIKSWHQRYLKDIFQNAKMLIAVSSSLARLIEPYTSRKSIEVIPNVVNTMFFTLPLNPRAKKPFIFLTVALLTPKKGIDILIRAFASVFKNNSNVELWIGGDGPLRSQLEYLAKMLDVASQIRFLGLLDREKVKLAMWKANAFVLPSYFETFGVVLIEAMSTGLPIISTKCGGPEDFITPKVGYLVSPGDIEGLANTMLTLYDNYSSFNSVEISEFVKDKFSYKSVASQLINIYKKVLLESTMNNLENKKSHE